MRVTSFTLCTLTHDGRCKKRQNAWWTIVRDYRMWLQLGCLSWTSKLTFYFYFTFSMSKVHCFCVLAPLGNLFRSRVMAPKKSSLEKWSASQTLRQTKTSNLNDSQTHNHLRLNCGTIIWVPKLVGAVHWELHHQYLRLLNCHCYWNVLGFIEEFQDFTHTCQKYKFIIVRTADNYSCGLSCS